MEKNKNDRHLSEEKPAIQTNESGENKVAALNFCATPSAADGEQGEVKVPASKLLAIRDALIRDDYEEAYHVLYSIASPNFDKMSHEVWAELEAKAKTLQNSEEIQAIPLAAQGREEEKGKTMTVLVCSCHYSLQKERHHDDECLVHGGAESDLTHEDMLNCYIQALKKRNARIRKLEKSGYEQFLKRQELEKQLAELKQQIEEERQWTAEVIHALKHSGNSALNDMRRKFGLPPLVILLMIFLFASCATQQAIEYGKVIRKYDGQGNLISEKKIPPTKRQKRNNFKIDPCWDKRGVAPCALITSTCEWNCYANPNSPVYVNTATGEYLSLTYAGDTVVLGVNKINFQ